MKVVVLALYTGLIYFPQEIFLVLTSDRDWVEPEPLCGRKNYVDEKLQWIEPATFQLVAQYLNQLRHSVPQKEGWKRIS